MRRKSKTRKENMFNWVKNILPGAAAARASSASAAAHEAEQQRVRGNALLDQGEWDQAAACYRQAIALVPGDLDAHINLGFVLMEQQRYLDAQSALKQALALDPQSADAHYMLGTIARGHGKH